METKKLLKSLKRRFSGMLCFVMFLAVSQGAWSSSTVTKDEVITIDVSGHNWFSNDNFYPRVYINNTVVGVASGYNSSKVYDITITSTMTGTLYLERYNGSSAYNKNTMTERSNSSNNTYKVSGEWTGSWSTVKAVSGTVYYDNTNTKFANCYQYIGRSNYTQCYQMNRVSGTQYLYSKNYSFKDFTMWYVSSDKWWDSSNEDVYKYSYHTTKTVTMKYESSWESGYAYKASSTLGSITDYSQNIQGYTWSSPASTQVKDYAVTINAGSGGAITVKDYDNATVSNGANKIYLTVLKVTVTPNSGYNIKSVTIGGTDYTSSAKSGTVNYTMTAATTIVAEFEQDCTPPTAFSVSGPSSVCAGSNAEITLSGSQTGYTYELYKDGVATSTTQAGTGSSLTFSAKVSGSNAAAFTIKGYVTGTPSCSADMNGTATVTPTALPSAPTGSNINVCSGSDAVFTASQTNNRCIDWYTASTGGTKLATCQTSYTKTNLTSNYTVYVEARNADNGCVSQSRTAITATAVAKPTITETTPASGCIGTNVNIGATASSGATVRWYEASTGGTALYTGTSYTVSSISATKTYYAEAYNSTLDCASTGRTGVTATAKALNNVSNITFSPASIKKGDSTTATATITTDGGTGTWSTSTPSLISFTNKTANPTTISADGIGTAKVTYTLTGGCSGTGAVNSKTVDLVINSDCDVPSAGTISGTTAICAGGSVSLSVSGYTSTNTTLQWNKNGSPVAEKTSNTYTESNVTESATYTVTVTRTDVDNCSKTTDAGYEVTVTAIPTITAHTDGSRCGTGTVTLGATASAGDVKWYAASTGGSAIATGASYSPNVSATTTYYVSATQNNCTTATRTAVTATVKTVPSIGSISKSPDECGAGNITFQANTVTSDATVTWYESSSQLGTGNSYTFNSVPAGTSHTVKAKASKDGCESGFTTELTGTRKAVPSLTIGVTSSAITAGETDKTYGWEYATFTTSSTDGASITGGITQTTEATVGKAGIIEGNKAKGHVGDAFTGSYTATGTNGCTTTDSKTVTVIKAVEVCN